MITDQHKDVIGEDHGQPEQKSPQEPEKHGPGPDQGPRPGQGQGTEVTSTKIFAIFRQADLPTVTLLNDPRIACKLGWSY